MQLSETTTTQLIAARHTYYLAKQNLESEQTVRLFAGINLLHDTVEIVLWAAAAVKNVGKDRIELLQLFNAVSGTLPTSHLPFRTAVVQLNRIRINSKHYGICPDRKEARRLLVQMTEFLLESVPAIFGVNFWTISLVDLLSDQEIKEVLAKAEALFDQQDYLSCITECRKIIFIKIESLYAIDKFRDPEAIGKGLFGPFSKAPYYTRNREWIDRNVKDPFGYIVLDHDDLNQDLIIKGIDAESFWNIWRGTPEVFRYAGSKEWLVKRNFAKEAIAATEEHATYILEQTIEIALSLEEYSRKIRTLGHGGIFSVRLKRENVNIYDKADRQSSVISTTHEGLNTISVSGSTPGLRGDGEYWRAAHVELYDSDKWYFGYIWQEDIDFENPTTSCALLLDK